MRTGSTLLQLANEWTTTLKESYLLDTTSANISDVLSAEYTVHLASNEKSYNTGIGLDLSSPKALAIASNLLPLPMIINVETQQILDIRKPHWVDRVGARNHKFGLIFPNAHNDVCDVASLVFEHYGDSCGLSTRAWDGATDTSDSLGAQLACK